MRRRGASTSGLCLNPPVLAKAENMNSLYFLHDKAFCVMIRTYVPAMSSVEVTVNLAPYVEDGDIVQLLQ